MVMAKPSKHMKHASYAHMCCVYQNLIDHIAIEYQIILDIPSCGEDAETKIYDNNVTIART